VTGWRLGLATLVAIVIGVEAGGAGSAAHGGGAALSLRGVRELVAPELPHVARAYRAVDRVRAYAPVVSHGSRRRRVVALTFDDGPGPFTWRVVRELQRMHVAATFFQVGRQAAEYPWAARLVARSFAVGDHTFSHAALARLHWAAQLREVRWGGAARGQLFRPPYESYDRQTLGVMRVERKLMVLWDVDARDWTRPGVGRIVTNVVRRVRPGSIVLLHDGGGVRWQTVAALPLIVRQLRARGYRFVTVPRMMRVAPPFRG
jgi:peptidoglycan/xylan/chitin deacetylase (PgdA/CDA1 family)